ncbi:MAG: prolyl oligopeptidase family serine peptidase, partial [Gammaproteobacteria bacterium]|nr:prolyl oligopeptidase family serine peptidase [Gammaproteobacteria bacterium]
ALADNHTDPHFWLEEIEGKEALEWVQQRNQKTFKRFTTNEQFEGLSERLKSIMDSDARIPYVNKIGEWYYNFWQDQQNPKGVLRRTSLEEYKKEEPDWQIVLDIDELSERESENWVYKGSTSLREHNRTLIHLSRGGSDAAVIREFDFDSLSFVENGFYLAEAKGAAVWLSLNELLVSTDFGNGTLTESGYPRIVKLLNRGESLENAKTIFEGESSDVAVSGYSNLMKGYETNGIYRSIDFYTEEMYRRDESGELHKLDKPLDGDLYGHKNWIFITTKTEWNIGGRTYPGNSLLVISRDAYHAGNRAFEILFQPTADTFLSSFGVSHSKVFVDLIHDVQDEVWVYSHSADGWTKRRLSQDESFLSIDVDAVDKREDDRYWYTKSGFLTPPTLSIGDVNGSLEELKKSPATFDSSRFEVSQHWVTSKDGTRVPYFLIRGKGAKGPQPTLMYGYGGFQLSMFPSYMQLSGPAWLERGGSYVMTNIRGGGEFGPQWHLSALKENRVRAYEDFIAIAEDLIERELTSPSQLGAMGGSNGGLLMGNMLTMRPDLFGALVIAVPLIDMRRYHQLLAGASWMAEYGDPDNPDEWEFIQTFSPYHNLKEDANYPEVLVTSSTKDDRVHPGHARKLVAKMTALGHDVWYYENTEGGHAGATDNSQRAFVNALEYEFLWDALNTEAHDRNSSSQ